MLSRGGARGVTKAELGATLIQRTTSEAPQRRDVLHRTGRAQEDDQLLREGRSWLCVSGRQDRLDATRTGRVDRTLPEPRTIAMEATIFTGWIYDHLLPHAEKVKVAHPLMLRAIALAKKKNHKSTPARSPTACAAIFCPSATWPRQRSATGDGSCATGIWW